MTPEILAPKVAALDSGGRGGTPELTPLDVAAALAGLPPGPYHLACLAWVDDHRAEPDLVRALCHAVSPPMPPGTGEGRPYLAALALAIAEYGWPPRRAHARPGRWGGSGGAAPLFGGRRVIARLVDVHIGRIGDAGPVEELEPRAAQDLALQGPGPIPDRSLPASAATAEPVPPELLPRPTPAPVRKPSARP